MLVVLLKNYSATLSNGECFLKNDEVKISYWISSPYLMQIVIFELTSTVTTEIDRHVMQRKQTTHLQHENCSEIYQKKVNEHLSPRSFDVSKFSCRLSCVSVEECFGEDTVFFHEGHDSFSSHDSSIIAWCDDVHSYYCEQINVLESRLSHQSDFRIVSRRNMFISNDSRRRHYQMILNSKEISHDLIMSNRIYMKGKITSFSPISRTLETCHRKMSWMTACAKYHW